MLSYMVHGCVQATRVARENLEKVIKRGDNLSDLQDRAGTSCFCDVHSLWEGNDLGVQKLHDCVLTRECYNSYFHMQKAYG